jgi:hypothetical protein
MNEMSAVQVYPVASHDPVPEAVLNPHVSYNGS